MSGDSRVTVSALVKSEEHVCYRYRVKAFADALAKSGLGLDPRLIPKQFRARRRMLRDLADSDVVLVQRKLFSRLDRALLRRQSRRLVYDFDDAIMVRHAKTRWAPPSWRRRRRFAGMCSQADLVIAGNAFLADRASEYGRNVHVVPTCVDVDVVRPQAGHRRDGCLVLGWIGSRSTLTTLRREADLLNRLARTLAGTRLKLICDVFFEPGCLPVEKVRWTAGGEADALAGCDVGISILPDDVFSRGKCGLKLLQYMAAGLPVVASPVGVHSEIVADGRTGFLATTPDQWIERLSLLASDRDLRERMGQAGRRRVEQLYSTRVWGPRLARLLAALVED